MKKKNRRGGARKNAGRNPAADPKKRITFWLEQSKIKANGGEGQCKKAASEFLNARATGIEAVLDS